MQKRINKYLCESGICSRKAADEYVQRGAVYINENVAQLGDKVLAGDTVTLNGQTVWPLSSDHHVLIAFNKPVGIVCTASSKDTRNIVDYIGHRSRIYPVGRLDKESQGLILLTNQSALVDKILQSENGHEKEYRVTVNKLITEEFIAGMSAGVPMLGTVTKSCAIVKESDFVFKIILVQGLNRQIRRMCKHFNYAVEKLERVRIMHINSTGLSVGQWRDLTDKEIATLHQSLQAN